MSKCDTNEEGVVIDPITFDPIPPERLVSFEQFGNTFCFDMDVLARSVESSGRYENPINRQPLPRDLALRIDQYISRKKITIYVISPEKSFQFYMNPHNTVGDVIVQIYRSLGRLQDIGQSNIKTNRGISLYDLDLLQPLSAVVQGKKVNLHLANASIGGLGMRMNKLYRYAQSAQIEWLSDIIPEQYRVDPPPPVSADENDHAMIADFALSGLDRAQEGSNVPNEYFLQGISRLLVGSKISAQFAKSVEKALSSRIKSHPDGRWNDLLHSLYSHVVDPFNLDASSGIQSQHYRDRWDRPPVQAQSTFMEELIRAQIEQLGNQSFDI